MDTFSCIKKGSSIERKNEHSRTIKLSRNQYKDPEIPVKRNSSEKDSQKRRQRRARIKKGIVAALICVAPLVILSALIVP